MQYRMGKHGEQISLLGYGCMRFTRSGGGIDLDKAERELMAAIDAGVNYLDTAYIYPGSEAAVGEILRRNQCRDRVLIATKLPQYLIRSRKGIDRCFDEELKRLCTDHVDFYLMHMLADVSAWEKLRSFGIEEWIAEKKASGQIRNIGFSFHGGTAAFLEVLNAYDWDFCQIQYNYMDETTQAGRRGLETAAARGIPVIIMEPLRGGRLANQLPPAAKELLEKEGKGRSAAEWGLRWLWDQPGVTCVLSGMHSMDMVTENVAAACCSKAGCLAESERALIENVKAVIQKNTLVSCTGCGYCQPCPAGVDIPGTFTCYNTSASEGLSIARKEYMRNTLMRKNPVGASRCIGCGKCVSHCPQQIPIPEKLQEARKVLETPLYHLAGKALRLFKLW